MFRAFFDESGTNPEETPAFTMAGFLGRVEEWERASDAWDACLTAFPSIKHFSHREAHGLYGQFEGWDRADSDRKVLALARVICDFDLLGFGVRVPFEIFAERDKASTKGLLGTRPYDWAFASVVSAVLTTMARRQEQEKVDFVFDPRNELRACRKCYEELKEDVFFASLFCRAGECVPGSDTDFAAVQMADLIAWEYAKAGDTGVMSEVFNLIRTNNGILKIKCEAPPHFGSQLKFQKTTSAVHAEAVEFLKKLKQGKSAFESAEEIIDELSRLLAREAYANVEMGRLLTHLDADEDYQKFRREYISRKEGADE